jgi:hypothetical protein
MLPKHAFINADGTVVNVIVGNLTPAQQQLFLLDQAMMFGATQVIEVEAGTSVWIGGSYDAAQGFLPPPQPEPEPEPEILEGTSEVIEEPVAMIEETTPEPEATEPDL